MKTKNIRKPVVNHINRTITVTDTFMRLAGNPENEEFTLYMNLVASCPNYKTVIAKQRKAKKDPEKPPMLTYEKMGKYIACLRNANEHLALFEKVKAFAKTQPNPHLTVSRWFNESFPDYGSTTKFDAEGFPLVTVNCVPFEAYKQHKENKKEQIGA